jgi:hypothetical protein
MPRLKDMMTQWRVTARVGLTFGIGLALLAAGGSCRAVRSAADLPGTAVRVVLPGKPKTESVDLLELQQHLMRFSDDFAAQMAAALDRLLPYFTNAPGRLEALQMRHLLSAEVWAIASGPNALANLLDMVTVVSLVRATIEDRWSARLADESVRQWLETSRRYEAEVWGIAGQVLTAAQQEELRQAIDAYYRRIPDPTAVLSIRAIGIASTMTRPQPNRDDPAGSGGVFSLIRLDPLSGLDPATRELAQTRLFGERALFMAQRMPDLIRWQSELLILQTAEMPEVQQVLTNTTRLATAVDRVSHVTEELPDRISRERAEIIKALEEQESNLSKLAAGAREALSAGSQMASNVDRALNRFDDVVERLRSGPPNTNAEPFRIQEYTQAAAQIDATAVRLTELLQTFDRTLGSTNLSQFAAQAGPVVEQAELRGRALVDYAFRKALLLVAVSCCVALVTALAYRVVARRIASRPDAGMGSRPAS